MTSALNKVFIPDDCKIVTFKVPSIILSQKRMTMHLRNNNPFCYIVQKLTNKILFKANVLANPPTHDPDKELHMTKISSTHPICVVGNPG